MTVDKFDQAIHILLGSFTINSGLGEEPMLIVYFVAMKHFFSLKLMGFSL